MDLDQSFSKSLYQQDFLKFNTAPAGLRITSPGRRNKPQPTSATFDWKNVRTLCEPVCNVDTRETKKDQANWWPDGVPKADRPRPKYTLDSTSRSDYRPIDIASFAKTRDQERRQSIEARKAKETGRERISYAHQYNSRLPSNQPERGKLHGSFINEEIYVWKCLSNILYNKIAYKYTLEKEVRTV